MRKQALALLFFLSFFSLSFSQSKAGAKDTSHRKAKSPLAATLFSTVVPGLGQAYNKKYWKMPILYAGLGTTLYFYKTNQTYYKEYKTAYTFRTDTLVETVDDYPNYTDAQLKELADYHRKYRDLNVILTGLIYTINIVDAYVDAHLTTFDVSDDLSMAVFPSISIAAHRKKPSVAVTLAFTF